MLRTGSWAEDGVGEETDAVGWYGVMIEVGSAFHKFGEACRNERFVTLTLDWTGGRNQPINSPVRMARLCVPIIRHTWL